MRGLFRILEHLNMYEGILIISRNFISDVNITVLHCLGAFMQLCLQDRTNFELPPAFSDIYGCLLCFELPPTFSDISLCKLIYDAVTYCI